MASEQICYLVETKDGFFRMYLHERYKLTLGPLSPGAKYQGNGPNSLVLRVYDGTKQRGVFHNVVSFRDASIEIEVGTIHADQSITWTKLPTLQIEEVKEPDASLHL